MPRDIIFVHIPRTAGTSTCGYFGIDNNHDTAKQLRQGDPQRWINAFTFAIVRNPWDRAVSYWSRIHRRRLTTQSFPEWVKEGMPPFWDGAVHPLDTSGFVTSNGLVLVDYLGQYETLQNSIRYVVHSTEFVPSRDFPHVRRIERKHYSTYYDDKAMEIVAGFCKWEIDRFGYKFEEEK